MKGAEIMTGWTVSAEGKEAGIAGAGAIWSTLMAMSGHGTCGEQRAEAAAARPSGRLAMKRSKVRRGSSDLRTIFRNFDLNSKGMSSVWFLG